MTHAPEALQQRVARLEGQLAAVNRELQSIAYAVSHDLRAPLRSITGFSQVLQEEAREALAEEHRHYLDRIQEAAGKLSGLIDGLLEISRAGSAELQPRPLDLTELALAIVANLDDRPAAVQIDIQPGMTAHADPRAMQTMLRQLLHNAVKVSARRPASRIALTQETNPTSMVLCVADNGVGFDPRYADKLFAPFQRLQADPTLNGAGIGLALVQRLAARHDGRVWAESQPGAGAKFFIELPRGPAA